MAGMKAEGNRERKDLKRRHDAALGGYRAVILLVSGCGFFWLPGLDRKWHMTDASGGRCPGEPGDRFLLFDGTAG